MKLLKSIILDLSGEEASGVLFKNLLFNDALRLQFQGCETSFPPAAPTYGHVENQVYKIFIQI